MPAAARAEHSPGTGIGTLLPHVSLQLLSGLIEAVAAAPYNGRADLPEIAADLQMEIDELFPVAETLQMLRFAELEGGDIRLTEAGTRFANAERDERKRIFARAAADLCAARRAHPPGARRAQQPHRAARAGSSTSSRTT